MGARGLRFLEIEGGAIRLARWAKSDRWRAKPGLMSQARQDLPPRVLEGSPYLGFEMRWAAIDDLFSRLEPPAQGPGGEGGGDKA